MSDHHHPHLHHLKSTPQLLRQASSSSASNLLTFLFLSLHIFSFRTVVENGTHLLTAFIDRDPSLKSLLSRLELAVLELFTHCLNQAYYLPQIKFLDY